LEAIKLRFLPEPDDQFFMPPAISFDGAMKNKALFTDKFQNTDYAEKTFPD
jgi:hypothetical protein